MALFRLQKVKFFRNLALLWREQVRVNVERGRNILMPQTLRDQQDGETKLDQQGRMGMPLRYNNDKQKKPLFSKGLSVCRLLFNSFSKLKIDENYKEKRRLFY